MWLPYGEKGIRFTPIDPVGVDPKQVLPGCSPSHVCCFSAASIKLRGSVEAAKELLDLGADVNVENSRGGTPLHFAAGAKSRTRE
jgi:ankyrin repeat protein